MTTYLTRWRAVKEARERRWAHGPDARGMCKAHKEIGVWIRSEDCPDRIQATQTIRLYERPVPQ